MVRYLCLDQKLTVDVQDVVYLCYSETSKKCSNLSYVYCRDGVTPLMYAAKRGNFEVVKTLVENGHAHQH